MKIIAIGEEKEGLYKLRAPTPNKVVSYDVSFPKCSYHTVVNKGTLWHSRLGYASDKILQKIDYISSSIFDNCNKSCVVFPLAEQHKLPFSLSTHKSSFNF